MKTTFFALFSLATLYWMITRESGPPLFQEQIQREEAAIGKSIVFIAGYDADDNRYYENARKYFRGQGYELVGGLYSLTEILDLLSSIHKKI